MSLHSTPEFSRHFMDRPLALALLASIMIHLALYGGWRWGKQLGWWSHQATWLLDLTKKARQRADVTSARQANPPSPKEIPLTFVDVDPARAATEAPKEAKFYGAHNSVAANPVPDTKPQPELDGSQTKLMRLEDNPRPNPQPLQPSPPPPQTAAPTPPPNPSPPRPSGNTVPSRPQPGSVAVDTSRPQPTERPRTLREARLRRGMLAGQKTQQTGGVREPGRVSLNVKATPFGTYDAAFIAAVQQRWFELIDNSTLALRSGKVVLEFRLNEDGSITAMTERETEVGTLLSILCQRAIRDPAPYPRWPSDMRRMIGKNYREVVFTFYYN